SSFAAAKVYPLRGQCSCRTAQRSAGGEGRPREARSPGGLLPLDVLLEEGERGAAAGDDAVRPAPEHRLAIDLGEVLGEVPAKQPRGGGLQVVRETGQVRAGRQRHEQA